MVVDQGNELVEAGSIEELKTNATTNVFFDTTKVIMYRKFLENRTRNETIERSDWVGGNTIHTCPRVVVRLSAMEGVDLNDGDCTGR